mmetsp:Transcript_29782/g.34158  ORF Transcript_29782/g.34158 Transcript_29782/m.34158 type:complete len:147 (+) Transcript_29782:605-1045(+)
MDPIDMVGDDDDPKLMHSDCGGYIQYLMNIRVGVHFEIPRLTMACRVGGSTEHTTNGSDDETTFMEDLQHDIHSNMRAASLMIRRHTHQVIPFCSHLLSDSLYNPAKHVEKVFQRTLILSFDGTNQKVLLIPWIYFTTATTTIYAN